jgi:acylphosphatase
MKKIFELNAHFFGKVQGVGFRFFVQKIASFLCLSGYVKNMADGSVFLCARGEKEKLMEFLQKIREEKRFLIEKEEISFEKAKKEFQGFQILS